MVKTFFSHCSADFFFFLPPPPPPLFLLHTQKLWAYTSTQIFCAVTTNLNIHQVCASHSGDMLQWISSPLACCHGAESWRWHGRKRSTAALALWQRLRTYFTPLWSRLGECHSTSQTLAKSSALRCSKPGHNTHKKSQRSLWGAWNPTDWLTTLTQRLILGCSKLSHNTHNKDWLWGAWNPATTLTQKSASRPVLEHRR